MNIRMTQFTGRRFFGTELHSPYDVHFLKADGIWNAIVRLKRQVVESVYYINFQKTDLCIKPDASINIFFKIYLHSHIPRHRFKKINPKIFGKFQKKKF